MTEFVRAKSTPIHSYIDHGEDHFFVVRESQTDEYRTRCVIWMIWKRRKQNQKKKEKDNVSYSYRSNRMERETMSTHQKQEAKNIIDVVCVSRRAVYASVYERKRSAQLFSTYSFLSVPLIWCAPRFVFGCAHIGRAHQFNQHVLDDVTLCPSQRTERPASGKTERKKCYYLS